MQKLSLTVFVAHACVLWKPQPLGGEELHCPCQCHAEPDGARLDRSCAADMCTAA